MKKVCLFVLLSCTVFAYADELTNILSGKYKPKTMTTEQIDSVFLSVASPKSSDAIPSRFSLEYENKVPIYRRSFEADWYVVDHLKETRTHLGEGKVRDAVLSPNNKYVVYAKDNNLFIYKLDFMTEVPITTHNGLRTMTAADGSVYREPLIFNGIADWLYEEEFGQTRLFEFSPDSKQVAFVRLDVSDVQSFQWQTMLDTQYPKTHAIRYPKVGCSNPRVSVCVYDIYYKTIKTMDLGSLSDCYIPRIKWTNPIAHGKEVVEPQLLVQKINRDQNEQTIYKVNPKSTLSWILSTESSEQYFIDYALWSEWKWLSDESFIMLSEQNGWSQASLCTRQGQVIRRLTPLGMDVTKIYGVDEKRLLMYYQAAPNPLVRHVYSVNLKTGEQLRLSTEAGWHNFYFSSDWSMMIDHYNSNRVPDTYKLYELKNNKWNLRTVLLENETVARNWQLSGLTHKSFFRIKTDRGDTLDAWMILPTQFDSARHYPVVVMQYSGIQSQRVCNNWKKGFGHYLASQGYVVMCADPRGSGAHGRAWRNATYMHLGQKEAEDQLSVARFAASLPFTDKKRMAIVGWSYGGFQSIRTMCELTSPFRCGIAIAPVTDWRLYDSGYTERYMRRSQVNESGYDAADLSSMVSQLKGRLLLIHGLADDNVHVQNTFQLVDALVKAGKQFDMQIYPDDNHFLRQRENYEHLHRRILLFLQEHL